MLINTIDILKVKTRRKGKGKWDKVKTDFHLIRTRNRKLIEYFQRMFCWDSEDMFYESDDISYLVIGSKIRSNAKEFWKYLIQYFLRREKQIYAWYLRFS